MQVGTQKNSKGFSLIELAIVLTIIASILGAIVGGQALIQAAKIQRQIKALGSYETAIYQFKEKYDALPGDIRNPASKGLSASPDIYIGNSDDAMSGPLPYYCSGESFILWKHLNESGFLPGAYSDGSMLVGAPGTSYPKTMITDTVGLTTFYNGTANAFILGITGNYGGTCTFDFFRSEDNYAIDVKIDDGRPLMGTVLGGNSYYNAPDANCVTGTDPRTAVYTLSSRTRACIPKVEIGIR